MKTCGVDCKYFDRQAERCRCIPNAPIPAAEGGVCQLESGAAERMGLSKAKVFELVCRRCGEIASLSGAIRAQSAPVSGTNPTAYATLMLPAPIFVVNQRLKSRIAELYSLADAVFMSKTETGVVLSFIVVGTEG